MMNDHKGNDWISCSSVRKSKILHLAEINCLIKNGNHRQIAFKIFLCCLYAYAVLKTKNNSSPLSDIYVIF